MAGRTFVFEPENGSRSRDGRRKRNRCIRSAQREESVMTNAKHMTFPTHVRDGRTVRYKCGHDEFVETVTCRLVSDDENICDAR